MNTAAFRRLACASLLCLHASTARAAAASTQMSSYTAVQVDAGPGGYQVHFSVQWSCDDNPQVTTSAPGRIDVLDASGSLVAELSATITGGAPDVSLGGGGVVSGLTCGADQLGAGSTPAEGFLTGTWSMTGLAPGAYTLRFWRFQESEDGRSVSQIVTQAADAGGSGPLGASPSPTPAPAAPPTVSLNAAAAATALAPFALAAAAASGASPLARVTLSVSTDSGASWQPVAADTAPPAASDALSGTWRFSQSGGALVRAVAVDASGLQAVAQQAVAVAKAPQPPVTAAASPASVPAGLAATFTASGGATGNYSWSGALSGVGAAQSAAFGVPGTYTATVIDAGDATYAPSEPASASVVVTAAFYTLVVAATPGGSASGGGSYAPLAQANAAAVPAPGFAFVGWSGDASGGSPLIAVVMDADKTVTAAFARVQSQTITVTAPAAVTTRSPAFALQATASSGLPVSFALDSGPATLNGSLLAPSGAAGAVVLTATQPGNAFYLPAPPVVFTVQVGPVPPGVTLTDDGPGTRRSDKLTLNTSFRSGAARSGVPP